VAGINPTALIRRIADFLLADNRGRMNVRAYEAERRAPALAELDRAKTTFFGNVSHELRTPLTLMLAPIEELLQSSRCCVGRCMALASVAHRNGLRLLKLVNTILDFARIEADGCRPRVRAPDLAIHERAGESFAPRSNAPVCASSSTVRRWANLSTSIATCGKDCAQSSPTFSITLAGRSRFTADGGECEILGGEPARNFARRGPICSKSFAAR
jgi:K+-sensing histidine kinase KdpD